MGYQGTAEFDDSREFEAKCREQFANRFYAENLEFWNATKVTYLNDMKYQKEIHADLALSQRNGLCITIDDKFVKPPEKVKKYPAFSLESMSDTTVGRERPGWMKTASCRAIMWWFVQQSGMVDAWYLPFKKMQELFYKEKGWYQIYKKCLKYNKYRDGTPANTSEVCVVPIEVVTASVPGCIHYELSGKGEFIGIEGFPNVSHCVTSL